MIDVIGKLPASKVAVDLAVHEPGYDRTVTAGEIASLIGIGQQRKKPPVRAASKGKAADGRPAR